MFTKLLTGALALSLAATMAMGAVGVTFNVASGDKEEVFNDMVNNKIESIGFILSDPHERINDAYQSKYGTPKIDGKPNEAYDKQYEEYLDNLGFFSIANDEKLRELLIKAPELGGFSPFNLHIYKVKGEDKTYVGHVNPETMLDIVGVKDKEVRKEFVAMFPPLDALVDKEIGGVKKNIEYDKLTAVPMMKFEYEFERPKDLADFIDEFQGEFEAAFEENKYIIAGYKNFKEAYNDLGEDFSKYDAYWVYSLCHFTFSYSIFNKGRPDAGVFAPCSMYMYIEKGSNKLEIGMPKLENWIAVMGIKDQKKVDAIHKLDKEIVSIMEGLGAKSK
jgi:uncharacterized protein (DUF302 family)